MRGGKIGPREGVAGLGARRYFPVVAIYYSSTKESGFAKGADARQHRQDIPEARHVSDEPEFLIACVKIISRETNLNIASECHYA